MIIDRDKLTSYYNKFPFMYIYYNKMHGEDLPMVDTNHNILYTI